MLGRTLPVMPVAPVDTFEAPHIPPPCDDSLVESSPKDRRARSAHRHETTVSSRTTRRWVTITFDDAETPQSAMRTGTMSSLEAREADRDNVEDLFVKRVRCCYTTFARHSSASGWDQGMEEKFAQLRYMNFRTAFIHASFFMMLGTLGLAANSFSYSHYKRAVFLTATVAPLYLCYGLFALRRKQQYLSMNGKIGEKTLIGLLCFQMFCIVTAEWLREDFDYGLLTMHIGFVHNFTPLGAGAMQIVTAAFGLLPYIGMKIARENIKSFPSFMIDVVPVVTDTAGALTTDPQCLDRKGTEALVVRLIVPVVIFLYQVIVTMRRDESLRLDLLCRLNLVVQQRLLDAEKTRNEGLLMSMLPRKIIEALQNNDPVEPQLFEDVTVVFIEICHFDHLCAKLFPSDVVEVLNIIYLEFDRLSDMLQVYKVETVGEVYMAVVGCPEPIANHADVAAHFALAAQQSMLHIKGRIALKVGPVPSRDNTMQTLPLAPIPPMRIDSTTSELKVPLPNQQGHRGRGGLPAEAAREDLNIVIHVGLNSGPIRAGIVGMDSPRYKLFGDTVNTASRMESTCEPGRVQVSRSTLQRFTKGMFQTEDRGEIPVKGKGTMRTAYLNGYCRASTEENRRVLIEHGCISKVTSSGDDFSPHGGEAVLKLTSTRPAGNTSILEDEMLRLCSGTSGTSRQSPLKDSLHQSKSSTSALVSAALGQNFSQDFEDTGGSRSLDGAKSSLMKMVNCLDRFQLLFLMVPADQKQFSRLSLLRQDQPEFELAMRDHRILFARNLTIAWLLVLALVGGMDYFMDVLEEDLQTYRTAIVVRTLGNSVPGLVYLLLLLLPDVRKASQHVTVAMLVLQGLALIVCGTVLYNSEPSIIALYSAYILFYTVCTVAQRLFICLAAVMAYVFTEFGRCGVEGVRNAASNITFLVVFTAAMACSLRLQEYLQHVSHWEQRCNEKRLEEIVLAQAAGAQLLTTLLPPHVVHQVGENLTSPIAEHHSDVTILFTDIKGFTAYSSRITAQKLVTVLNSMYSAFDEIIANWALHKVEIIGDAYFVSAGCPPPQLLEGEEETDPSEYAMRAVEVGLALLRTLPSVCDDTTVQMRAGLHTGSVVAGVVGKKGPRYHLFGSTVAYAEKMESHGIPGKVQLSAATHALLQRGNHAYDFEERNIPVEGEEGLQKTWVVNRSNSTVAFQIQKKLMTQRRSNQQKNSTCLRASTPATTGRQPTIRRSSASEGQKGTGTSVTASTGLEAIGSNSLGFSSSSCRPQGALSGTSRTSGPGTRPTVLTPQSIS